MQQHLFALRSYLCADAVKRGGFLLGEPVFFLSQDSRQANQWHGSLDFTGSLNQALLLRRNSHRAAGDGPISVDSAAAIALKGRAGKFGELGYEIVYDTIVRAVKVWGGGELRIAVFNGIELLACPLFDGLSLFWREQGEAALQFLNV